MSGCLNCQSKTAHETGGHRSAVSFIEYATMHYYFHCKRGSQDTEHFSLHKNTMAEDLGAQELQNPSQAKDPT